MRPRRTGSPKRKLRQRITDPAATEQLNDLARRASYGGNPEHKRNPGDFGLSPPALPRQGKSLCDDTGIVRRQDAVALLKHAFERGLVSVQERNGWPQNIWAVTDEGIAVEGMLENPTSGAYHG